MKQVFLHYQDWEDWKFGMYDLSPLSDREYLTQKSADLLSNPDLFREIAIRVINEWPKSSSVNITNPNSNSRAWLGQASCCLNHSASEDLTRIAWGRLTPKQQDIANNIANEVINIFIEKNEKIKQLKLQFNA